MASFLVKLSSGEIDEARERIVSPKKQFRQKKFQPKKIKEVSAKINSVEPKKQVSSQKMFLVKKNLFYEYKIIKNEIGLVPV